MHHFVSKRLLTLGAGLFVLQYALSPFLGEGGGRPDFLYLMVLDYAFFWSWELTPFFGLAVGLLRDFFGGHLFGIETASLAVTSLLLWLGIQKLERENFLVRLAISALFVGLTEILSFSLGIWLDGSRAGAYGHTSLLLMKGVFWTTFYTLLVSPAFFAFTSLWFKRTPVLKQYELFR